jgi:hypothetical protein
VSGDTQGYHTLAQNCSSTEENPFEQHKATHHREVGALATFNLPAVWVGVPFIGRHQTQAVHSATRRIHTKKIMHVMYARPQFRPSA